VAKLPTRDDLGPLPSAKTGTAMVRAERSVPTGGAAVGQAMARVGPQITKLGLTLQEKRDEADRFEAERRFQEFKFNEAKTLDETMRSVQPGQAGGFADSWTGSYAEKATQFFETIPEHLKPEYDEKLFGAERSFYGKAKSFEYGEQKRFAGNAIEDHKNRLAQSDDLDQARADYDSLLAANPWLTPIEKDEQRRKDLEDLDEMNVAYRVSRGDALEEIIRDLSGSRHPDGKPILHNADGSVSTERTTTIEAGGKWFNIPTIVDGKPRSVEEAVALWEAGKNKAVGEFKSLEDAETAAIERSRDLGEIIRDRYPNLSPKKRAALIYKAKTALSAATQQTIDDDIARIKTTGMPEVAPDGTTALDRAQGILQPNVLERKKQDTAAAIVEYNAVTPLPNMSAQEAQAHIASIIPRAESSGASYEAGLKAQEKAEAAWKKIVELREKDPALAVADAPEVIEAEQKIAEAQAAAQAGPEAGGPLFQGNAMSEADMLAARLEARRTAQIRLGLKPYEISILTHAEAKELLGMGDPSTMEPDAYYDALVQAAGRAEQAYGSYAHEALKAAISFQRRNKEEKEISSTVLAKIAQGIAPDPRELRQMGDLQDIDRIGRVFSPSDTPDPSRPAIGYTPQVGLPTAPARRPTPGRAVTLPPSTAQEEWLLANPRANAAVFDREFGAGAAKRVIERARKPAKPQSGAPSK
jgi:hypothetical protein